MFVNGSAQNEQFLDRTIIDASYQASLHLAEGFQRRRLKCEKLNFKKSSPLKPLGQMNRNLVGRIYGRSSTTIAHFVPIVTKHGHHRQFLFLIG
jgi:hypothetical protein